MTVGQKGTQYVRFSEPHKSGYFHFHAVFDRYVPWNKVNTLWAAAVETCTGLDGSRGGVHVKGINSAENTAFYIVKYVTKSSELKEKNMRVWSKSSRISIFPEKKTDRAYAIFNSITNEWYGLYPNLSLLDTNITQLHKELLTFELFPGYYFPPKDLSYEFH